MTTIEEIMSEVKQLSQEDRLRVLELLTSTLQEEWRSEQIEGSSLSALRGVLRSEGSSPSDAELADMYAAHLLEKYS